MENEELIKTLKKIEDNFTRIEKGQKLLNDKQDLILKLLIKIAKRIELVIHSQPTTSKRKFEYFT